MKIVISQLFREESSEKYRIRPRHAEEAILDPDRVDLLLADKETSYSLYAKRISTGNLNHWNLVIAEKKNGQVICHFGLRVPGEMVLDVPKPMSPVEMLDRLLLDYGFDISVGGERGRLHYHREIPLLDPAVEIIKVHAPPDSPFVQQAMVKVLDNPRRVECSIAFAINSSFYEALLA